MGQSQPTPKRSANDTIPRGTVPAKQLPASPAANPTRPDSATESDLERELNKSYTTPNRLGPEPARATSTQATKPRSNTVSPKVTTKPTRVAKTAPDSVKTRQPVRAVVKKDTVRPDTTRRNAVTQEKPVQAPALPQLPAKGGIPPANVPSQRVSDAPAGSTPASRRAANNPAAGTPASTTATVTARPASTTATVTAKPASTTASTVRAKPASTTATVTARPASTTATTTIPRSKTALAGKTRLIPGIVSPNIVRPESLTLIRPNAGQMAALDSAKADSLKSPDSFATTVKYQAKDSTIYAADGQTVELFGEASVIYGEISLKADFIRLNYLTNEVYAKGRYDSTAKKWIGRPIFQDGEGKYDTKEIRYNFKSKKGKIQGVITQQGEGNVRGQNVKKDAEDNLYIGSAIYTTCNLATPHFHINASKLKVVHNKQVVAGPFNLVINQIPLPLGLPFGFFPFPKKKDIGVSGIIVPQYGEEPNGRGYYLRDGGYYWAVSENLGLQFKGQIYSRGSWGLGLSSAYNKRYRYSGGVNLQFNRNRSGDRVDTTQVPRNDFSFSWSHSPVPRGRGSFSANVNVSSNSFNQFNSGTGTNAYISNVAGSSVQYSRQFGQYARAGANIRVNQQFGQINQITGVRENGKTDVSSDFNFGINQISPFALKGGSGRWYESFRVGLDVSGSIAISNTIRTQVDTSGLGFPVVTNLRTISSVQRALDSIARATAIRNGEIVTDPNLIAFSLANRDRIWRNRTVQATYSIPISLPNFKLLRYINLTPGFSLQGNIYTKKLKYTYLDYNNTVIVDPATGQYSSDRNKVRIDTMPGFFPSYNFSANISMNTRFYGTYFVRGKRIEAIRHTVAPSISFSYVPDFTNPAFGQFQVLPATGSLAGLAEYRRTLSLFRGLGGSSGSGGSTQSAFISFGIVNQLEMKVRTRGDSTGQDFKKIPLFDNISVNGSYNLLAPDYNLSPISISANTQIFKNVSFNFSSTFDPYATRPYGGIPYYALQVANSGNEAISAYSYSQYLLKAAGYTGQQYARVPKLYAFQEGQGLARLTNLQAYISTRLAPKQADKKKTSPNATDATMKAINNNPELYVDFTIPWSLNISYTFSLTKLTPEISQVVQALTLTGDLSLTPKWKITFNTGYDFQFKSPTLTTIGINRDLHCWEMAFNWTPYSGSNIRSGNYSFDLRVRSSILQELKLSRRRSFYDNGGF
ncbi:putative LPS assembly protein LptD [Spirosoma agri]|nr:putative LPS assembly protein LptD [Spirosoma agri]